MSSEGTPLHGDRSAWNVMSFDTEHAKDIMDSTLRRHLPLPGAAGGVAQSDGTDWQRVSSLPLADLADATRGCIIRRGASDWEAYDAKTDGAALVGDGTDITSTLAPTWKGGHTFNDGITLSANSTSAGTFDINHECLLAGGNTALEAFVFQTDGTGITGTLRGAYLTASGGNTANTGTIRGAEIKARAGRPGETGNDVNVLEGFSVSSDAKTYDVTTHRGGEIILDGGAGTSTLAVGLRIANNFQANRATTSYGLQIYRDSFDYTADIQLSHGHTIADGASAIALNTGLSISGNIAVTGTVDGVDVADHSARHDAGGVDALSTIPNHNHTGDAGDGGQISHDAALSNVSADDHHSETHVINSTGPHAEASLTIGHFLRATGAAAFSFAAIAAGDLPTAIDVAKIADGSVSNTEFQYLDDYATIGLVGLTAGEVNQLENIGTATISAAQWAYLGAMNQGLATTGSPTFNALTATSIIIGANTITTSEWANLDGLNQTLATTSGPTFATLTVPNAGFTGIGAALERIEYYTAGYVSVMGAKLGVGVAAPAADIETLGSALSCQFQRDFAADGNTIRDVGTFMRTHSAGAGANGIGGTLNFSLETTVAGNIERAARWAWIFDDATDGAEDGSQIFYCTMNGDVTSEVMRIVGSTRFVGYGTDDPQRLLHARVRGVATNTIGYAARLSHITSNIAVTGFGVGLEFELEENDTSDRVAGIVEVLWTDAGETVSADADFMFKLVENDAVAAERGRLTSGGDWKIPADYYSGGNQGLSGTLTLDDGTNWRITLTFLGGILTGQTTGASVAAAGTWT